MNVTPLSPELRQELLRKLERFTSDDDSTTDQEQAARFLPRYQFNHALESRCVILRGDRGAGKTALFKVATSSNAPSLIGSETWCQGYADDMGHPSGDTLEALAADVDDRLLRTFWLTHLAGRILHYDNRLPVWVPEAYIRAPVDPRAWLHVADADLGRVQTSLDACEALLANEHRTITLAYDHLDRIGITNREVRVRASSALMAIWLSLSTRYPSIRGKLFLRNDLFAAGLSRSADASKLETRSVDLEWSTQDLYRALLRRLGADQALRNWAREVLGPSALSEREAQGWMPPDPLPVADGTVTQKAVADAIAGEIMGTGVKKGYTYRWIPNHLQDGNARIVPRSLFNLVRFAAENALTTMPRASGHHLLHHTDLHAALVKTSERRVNELAEEHPIVLSLGGLRGRMAPFTFAELVEALEYSAGHDTRSSTDLVEDLVGIGVLTERSDKRIDLPDIYRFGLGVKRKGGVARPK